MKDCISVVLALSAVIVSQGVAAAEPISFTAACEEALALSAAPDYLRESASIMRHAENKYLLSHEGSGPLTCLVQRNHPQSIIPVCYDKAGAEAILPAAIWESEQVLSGRTISEVKQEFPATVAAGRFHAPRRAGLAYMLSAYNRIYTAQNDEIITVGPHLMFYAPGLSNADIGGSYAAAQQHRGLPFVINQGIHGYMVSFVETPASTEAVEQSCAGQLTF
ncbi:MAG: hypothetical protein Tsb002_20420 [Wenzhouxiangellaceae bacterium]